MPLLFFPFFLSSLLPWHGAAFYKEIACCRLLLVECAVLGAVHAVLERSCCLHVMPMLSKLECGVQGAVWRSCWACCPGVEGAAGYCPAADVPCRCCQACCPSAEGVASRVGCCLATAVPCRCCRVLLLFRPWGELLSMLSSAAECCCCPGRPSLGEVLPMLSSSLVLGVEKEGCCCPRA
jgi:hypothetical protein